MRPALNTKYRYAMLISSTTNVRGVAQLGSAPAWGAGGRRFESCLPDHSKALPLSSY